MRWLPQTQSLRMLRWAWQSFLRVCWEIRFLEWASEQSLTKPILLWFWFWTFTTSKKLLSGCVFVLKEWRVENWLCRWFRPRWKYWRCEPSRSLYGLLNNLQSFCVPRWIELQRQQLDWPRVRDPSYESRHVTWNGSYYTLKEKTGLGVKNWRIYFFLRVEKLRFLLFRLVQNI